MLLRNFITKIKTRYRKHQFDLAHPQIATVGGVLLNGVPIQQTIFTCSVCGKQLALDMKHMVDLPFQQAYGCTGRKKDEPEEK